jgi:hypothetical protein
MRKLLVAIFVVSLMFVRPVAAQSINRLSRPSAATLLGNSQQLKKFQTSSMFVFISAGALADSNDKFALVLQRAGYISLNQFGAGSTGEFGAVTNGPARLTPKASGENFICDNIQSEKKCNVVLGRAGQVDVTGIAAGDQMATIEFTWKWSLTSIGEELQRAGLDLTKLNTPMNLQGLNKAKATLRLYDDGWRIVEVTGYYGI